MSTRVTQLTSMRPMAGFGRESRARSLRMQHPKLAEQYWVCQMDAVRKGVFGDSAMKCLKDLGVFLKLIDGVISQKWGCFKL